MSTLEQIGLWSLPLAGGLLLWWLNGGSDAARKAMLGRFEATQRREAVDWIAKLRGIPDMSVATIYAMALDIRAATLAARGLDLLQPAACHAIDPALCIDIAADIRRKQKAGRQIEAAGLFVWLFSQRAMANPELLDTARDLWAELARVSALVPVAAQEMEFETGVRLRIVGCDYVPREFVRPLSPPPAAAGLR